MHTNLGTVQEAFFTARYQVDVRHVLSTMSVRWKTENSEAE